MIRSRECEHELVWSEGRLFCDLCQDFKDNKHKFSPYHDACGNNLRRSNINGNTWFCEECNEIFKPPKKRSKNAFIE